MTRSSPTEPGGDVVTAIVPVFNTRPERTEVLTGVMVVARWRRTNRAQLRQLLTEPFVAAATASGWQDQFFAAAASGRPSDLLLLLGWLWRRMRGLQMSVARPGRSSRGRKHTNG